MLIIRKIKIASIFAILIIILAMAFYSGCGVLAYQKNGIDNEIKNIEKNITEQQKKISDLKEKAGEYQKIIQEKQLKIDSLEKQLLVFKNRIAKKELDIKIVNEEIAETKNKIKEKNLEIKKKEEEIKKQKRKIIEFIRLIYKNDKKSYLEILILNDSFSEFFNYLTFTENIERELKNALDGILLLKEKLENSKDLLEKEKLNLDKLEIKLTREKDKLNEEKRLKEVILVETNYSEKLFQKLLVKAKAEQIAADNEILNFEKEKRALFKKQKKNKKLDNSSELSWPVNPSRGISAYFHDPDYPFRHLFEHPGIDIIVSQGTPIKAPANGYVARVKDAGFGYSYIMLIHSDGLSTVYGHVNKILVQEDEFVARGQIIGKVGGKPGTLGAGKLTTGAHLHLETRLDGIPVNPLKYLTLY
ncbi:MAG: peptidoglycan DD-metalloendopeptidase family protein [Patescibacteria group bacterium]|nr:peptidoglycan DD-metalloendopeptidase family protein [Patescibacteria group bacterium]